MKRTVLLLALCLGLPTAAYAKSAAALFAALESERNALKVTSFSLALQENVASVKEREALAEEQAFAARWLTQLEGVDAGQLSVCDRIDHEKARHEMAMVLRRADLGARPDFVSSVKDGLGANANRRAFYELLLDWQLGVDVSPDDIFAFGEREIAKANIRYDALQARMGFAGDDEGLAAYLRSDEFRSSDGAGLQRAFEEADAIVRAKLSGLFAEYELPPVKIARAEQAGPLAATPGSYDASSGTFFYIVPGDDYDLRNRDWLYLHEATPGHHFQIAIGATTDACKSALPDLWSPAYVEGWGAYVETLGRDLGLYATPAAEFAAVQWDMVRSARVAIDVGLNHRGWSDAEALSFWRKSVRGQDDIAQREIDRMRRWPAQVVTYKYGAAMFEAARERLAKAQGPAFDPKKFHDLALSRGPMPIPVFVRAVEEAARAPLK